MHACIGAKPPEVCETSLKTGWKSGFPLQSWHLSCGNIFHSLHFSGVKGNEKEIEKDCSTPRRFLLNKGGLGLVNFYKCCHVLWAFLENHRSRATWQITPRVFRSKGKWAWLIVCKSLHFIQEDECHYSETRNWLLWSANITYSVEACNLMLLTIFLPVILGLVDLTHIWYR